MGKLNIKNGTPVGSTHLCRSCSWGQVMTGYRESDLLVLCTNASPNLVVPFTMLDCTEYSDRHRPDWSQMEKLAIDIQPVRVSTRTTGFAVSGPAVRVNALELDEDEDEAALAR